MDWLYRGRWIATSRARKIESEARLGWREEAYYEWVWVEKKNFENLNVETWFSNTYKSGFLQNENDGVPNWIFICLRIV